MTVGYGRWPGWARGVVVRRTGGHTPGHSVVRLASGGDRLMVGGDSVFPPGFDCPEWHNGFDTEPEETARVRVGLLRELAATRQPFVATHLFQAVGRVAVARDVFRWVPAFWERISTAAVIAKILTHLGLSARAPPRSPARHFALLQTA